MSNRTWQGDAVSAWGDYLSPEITSLGTPSPSSIFACGSNRGKLIARSVSRFLNGITDQINHVIENVPSARPRRAGHNGNNVSNPDCFRPRDILEMIERRVQNAINANSLLKFVSSGSAITILGRPVTIGTVALAASLMLMGATSHAVIAGEDNTNSIAATAEIFPITMKQSSAGFASRVSEHLPGERFKQEALTALTEAFGNEQMAKNHLDLALAVMNTCIELPVPCTVQTAGLNLDPIHGRYILSVRDEEGFYNYSFMDVNGSEVSLAGQDGEEPVKNPYAWHP